MAESDDYDTCPDCEGDGNSTAHTGWYHKCPTCDGKGWVRKR